MDPKTVKDKIAEISRPLEAIEASGEMHLSARDAMAGILDCAAREAEQDVVPAVRDSEDTELRDEAARLFRRLALANSWLEGREEKSGEWIALAAGLAATDLLRDLITADRNRLCDGDAFEGIREYCQKGLVDKARRILAARLRATRDLQVRKRLEEFLAEPRNFLAPLTSAPSMVTMNGFGTMLWGQRARRPDGTYVATLCFVLLFLPIIPLKSYLVRRETQGWTFFGGVPLSPLAFWWRRLAFTGPVLAAFAFWGWNAWNSSSYVRETRQLANASTSFERRDYAGALRSLVGVVDPARTSRRNELARAALNASLDEVRDIPSAERFLRFTGPTAANLQNAFGDVEFTSAEAALARVPSRPLLQWTVSIRSWPAARTLAEAIPVCRTADEPSLLAAAADLHVQAGIRFPEDLLDRLAAHLLRTRHATWAADAMSYLRAADPARARPVLLVRAEAAWTGAAPGADLLALGSLPAPLRTLLELDAEADPTKRVAGLEKAADGSDGLETEQKTWHRLGVARRLTRAYGLLNEADPIAHPSSKATPWAVEASELAPQDAEARVSAIRHLLTDGDFAKAIDLGSRGIDDSRTALLVGIARARSGNPEEAARILRPLVERDLPDFTKDAADWEKALQSRMDSLWRSLQNGSADQGVLRRLNSLPQNRVSQEAQKWVRHQADRDPQVADLARKWRQRADVHPAASELAMIELLLGRAAPPGPERQARLEAAEKLFLELRKIQADDPQQELQLGQVYFWLGKETEGREIFSRLEKEGDVDVLMHVGEADRSLGRMSDARRVFEKAYAAADDKKKKEVALARALSTFQSEERLEWLRKCDTSNPQIRSDLDETEATVAMEKGLFAEALASLQRAQTYYADRTDDPTSFNNAAVVQSRLALATGDARYLLESLRLMRRAHEAAPEDGIILNNYVDQLRDVGIAALSGTALRPDLLHQMPADDWFDYRVPPLPPEEWAERAKIQPELRRAADLGARLVVLSPDNELGYQVQNFFFSLLRDGDSCRRLRESVESAPPVRQESSERSRAWARGEYTEAEKDGIRRLGERWHSLLPSLRIAGHPPTLGYALIQSAFTRATAVRMGIPGETFAAAVRDAEEAVQVFDAGPTRRKLAWFRMEQAAQAYASIDPEFDRWTKANPGLDASLLVVLYARKHPDRVEALREREEVRRAAEIAGSAVDLVRSDSWLQGWAWLEFAGHELREPAHQAIRNDPVLLDVLRVNRILAPGDAAESARAWLGATALGEKELADRIAREAGAAKLLPEFFGD